MLGRLFEVIVLLLTIRAVWKLLGGVFTVTAGARRTSAAAAGEPRSVKLVRDPVCGTYVSPDSAIADGKQYFCSEKCRDEYRRRA